MRDETMRPLAWLPTEWDAWTQQEGERPFVARQIFRWLHARGETDPAKMTDLSLRVRTKLEALALRDPLDVTHVHRAVDATRKLSLALSPEGLVETVLIPMTKLAPLPSPEGRPSRSADPGYEDADVDVSDEEGEEEASAGTVRVTQCISTQVGCAMGCAFCASGVAGLKRNMRADEVVAQVIVGKRYLQAGERLTNVVFMGMGEPLHNYEVTKRTLELLLHPDGLDFSHRRVTVSTSGLVPEIAKLGEDFAGKVGLAVSLHAPNDDLRQALMPINRKYPLSELMGALRKYPLPKRRRITFEYTLIAGKNDSDEDARALGKLLRSIPSKVNLIPVNPIEASHFVPPPLERTLRFQQLLVDAGYACFVRRRRGDEVSAACGQLVLAGAKPKVRVLRS